MVNIFLNEDGINSFITEDSINEFILENATTIKPDPPTSLTATAINSDQINLSWIAPTFIGTSAIIGYKIERESPVGGGFSTLVANTGSTGTTYSDSGLTMNTQYNYRVSTINSTETSNPSNESSDTTINVDAPTSLTATAINSDQINLSWIAPVITGGSAIIGYKIERESPVGGGFSTLVADTGSTGTTYSDSGLTMNTQYNYRVSAITSLDVGNASTPDSDTTINVDAPTSLTATTQPRSTIVLTWIAPVITGGSVIIGYKIERESPVGGGFSTLVSNTGSTGTTYSNGNLLANTEYNYRVSAITSLDVGNASTPDSDTTLDEDYIKNKYGEIFTKLLSTTGTSKPSAPTYAITNNLQQTVEIKDLFLLPTRNFTQKGSISILVGGKQELINLEESELLKDIGLFKVPLVNTFLKANQNIQFLIWNNTDSKQVSVKVLLGINKNFPNPDQFLREQINEVKGENRITSGDGGTSKTIYTCPSNKRAKINKIVSRVSVTGSASRVNLKINDVIIAQWLIDGLNPNDYATGNQGSTSSSPRPTTISINARKVWSDGSYPEFNIPYEDGQGLILEEGETIKYDGNFASTFNGTIDYFYSIIEEDL